MRRPDWALCIPPGPVEAAAGVEAGVGAPVAVAHPHEGHAVAEAADDPAEVPAWAARRGQGRRRVRRPPR
ncbi:hypothetical protein ACFQ0Q_35535 [Streptomyces aureus]